MRDILSEVEGWRAAGERVAIATVVRTWGSAPRQSGAKLAITESGKLAGSVSGGCVEGAVAEAALEALADGRPRLLHFGVADEAAWEVGLACGGSLDIWVNPHETEGPLYEELVLVLAAKEPVAMCTAIAGPGEVLGRRMLAVAEEAARDRKLPEGQWLGQAALLADARADLAAGQPAVHAYPDGLQVFVEVYLPPPELIMVGGVHIAIALTALAQTLGYRTIVVEPRRAFGNAERFPLADQLVSEWPDRALEQIGLTRSSAVAVLTHDSKLDDPALRVALASPAFYVGALGSRKTQVRRRERLLGLGLTAAQIDRLHGPIGLDIGARTPEEIALGILAEIVAAHGGHLASGNRQPPQLRGGRQVSEEPQSPEIRGV